MAIKSPFYRKPIRQSATRSVQKSFLWASDRLENGKLKLSYFGIRFKELLSQKVILFGLPLLVVGLLIFGGIYSSATINSLSRVNITDTYSFSVIVFSLFNLVLITFAVWKLFYLDTIDGQIKLELRGGFSKYFMYFYRLFLIFGLLAIIISLELSLNSIFYSVARPKNEIFAYRLFISPFLWLFFVSLLGMLLTLFFVVVIRTKVALVFSIILGIFILLAAPLGMHWNEIKIRPTLIQPAKLLMNNSKKEENENGAGLYQDFLTAEKYINLGENLASYQDLFLVLKAYKEYDFLAKDAIEKLRENPKEAEKYSFYRKLIEIGANNNTGKIDNQLIADLKESRNSLLTGYANFLVKQNFLSRIVKFNVQNDADQKLWLFSDFCAVIDSTKRFFQDRFNFKYGDPDLYYINSVANFNKKLSKNRVANPFYQLNLLFFGQHNDYGTDNLMNLNRPIFTQALNLRYEISFERLPGDNNETSRYEGDIYDDSYLIKSVAVSQNANLATIFFSYGAVIIFLSGLICVAYRPKK